MFIALMLHLVKEKKKRILKCHRTMFIHTYQWNMAHIDLYTYIVHVNVKLD